MSRYRKFTTIKNDLDFYSKQISARNKKSISMFRPRPLGELKERLLQTINTNKEVWSEGTNLYKLAYNYYGDQDLWWVIGMFNNKPTDAHWQVGDEVLIPTPVSKILEALDL